MEAQQPVHLRLASTDLSRDLRLRHAPRVGAAHGGHEFLAGRLHRGVALLGYRREGLHEPTIACAIVLTGRVGSVSWMATANCHEPDAVGAGAMSPDRQVGSLAPGGGTRFFMIAPMLVTP